MKSGDLSKLNGLDSSPNGGETSPPINGTKRRGSASLLLFGGLALGVLVGLTVTSFWFVRRNHEKQMPPLQRAEHLIQSCEEKIQEIQKALESLRSA